MTHALESLLALAETDDGKQQIRVMVAGLCGWGVTAAYDDYTAYQNDAVSMLAIYPDRCGYSALPDYAGSLDAMAEAMKDEPDHVLSRWSQRMEDTYLEEWRTLSEDEKKSNFSAYAASRQLRPEPWRWAIAFILTKQPLTSASASSVPPPAE